MFLSGRRQVSWLTGRCVLQPSQGVMPQWRSGKRSPLTVAGAAVVLARLRRTTFPLGPLQRNRQRAEHTRIATPRKRFVARIDRRGGRAVNAQQTVLLPQWRGPGSGPINMTTMVGLICADTRSKTVGRLHVFQGLATKLPVQNRPIRRTLDRPAICRVKPLDRGEAPLCGLFLASLGLSNAIAVILIGTDPRGNAVRALPNAAAVPATVSGERT